MKNLQIGIVGAGAMGSLLAHKFVSAGEQVCLIDLPARISQIKSNGLGLINPEGELSVVHPANLSDNLATSGQFDLVILATKAQTLPTLAGDLEAVIHDDSAIMTIQNGIPWWYFQGLDVDTAQFCRPPKLKNLDPEGSLEKRIASKNLLGCVAYPAAHLDEQGHVHHVEGVKFPIGELDGKTYPRTELIAQTMEKAGFKCRILDDIRSELWLKAWGSLSFNPISALTGGTMSGICEFPNTRKLVSQMMAEAQRVGEKLGVHFRHTIEKRIQGAHAVGPHKTSMLQDREAKQAMEVEALIGSIVELGKITDVPTPAIQAVYACLSLLDNNLQQGSAA